jgi:hypothetical protein
LSVRCCDNDNAEDCDQNDSWKAWLSFQKQGGPFGYKTKVGYYCKNYNN